MKRTISGGDGTHGIASPRAWFDRRFEPLFLRCSRYAAWADMGDAQVTVRNLEIIEVIEDNVLVVKARYRVRNRGYVVVRRAKR